MRWTREEYLDLMTFGDAKRPMFSESFGTLIGLDDEWRQQGASENEINLSAFDFDYVPRIECEAETGLFRGYPERVIEDTPEYTITLDSLGRRMKLAKGYATIPLPLDYPVKDMDSWLKVKPFYEFNEDRINWDHIEYSKKCQREGVIH